MTGELFINGKDAWIEWGVNMGEGFIDAIDAFVPMKKQVIENNSRLEHGKRVVFTSPRVDSRAITLHFTIKGCNELDCRTKRKSFEAELYKEGFVTVNVPTLGEEKYKLIYQGKSVIYGLNRSRTFCTFAAKFEEPNPMDRG